MKQRNFDGEDDLTHPACVMVGAGGVDGTRLSAFGQCATQEEQGDSRKLKIIISQRRFLAVIEEIEEE